MMHHHVRDARATFRIAKFAANYHLKRVIYKNPLKYGKWLRDELVSMGPTFIKLGQFLSTRTDIIDKVVAQELTYLQDNILPMPFEQVKHTIQSDLGRTVESVFDTIDPEPLASASIGQVHRARLHGKEVVVKVQRPYIQEMIASDLRAMKQLNNVMTFTSSNRANDLDKMIAEYERFLSKELDFKAEVENMKAFDILSMQFSGLIVPDVVGELCTERVIVMDYVPSLKVNDVEALKSNGINPGDVSQRLIQLFLYQIADAGIIHCDPHPGNIGIVIDDDFKIVLYDFGNVVYLGDNFRSNIKNLVFAIIQRDVDGFVDLLKQLKVLDIQEDQDLFEVKYFFSYFFNYLQNLDLNSFKESIMDNDLLKQANTPTIRIEQDFLSLIRVFSLIDGTCSLLDPAFNYFDALTPYTSSIMFDLDFLEYKARKDIERLTSFSSSMRNTERTVIQMGKRIRQAENKIRLLPWIVVGAMLIDDFEPWVKFMVLSATCLGAISLPRQP